MKLPDQPSYVLPTQSPKASDKVKLAAPAYRHKDPKVRRKVKRRQSTVVAARSGLGRNR
jgi:hypothetical protein